MRSDGSLTSPRESVKRPYNSRIVQVYLKLIELRYPGTDVHEVLDYAGMKLYEVSDEGHWFSQEQVDRFYEKIVQVTGNLTIAREAGRFTSAHETGTLFRRYILGFLGPLRAYAMLESSSALITRSSTFRVRRINSHSVEVTATPHPGVRERPYQCENRMGILESFALAFTHRLPKVEHTECLFRGGSSCRYRIQWEPTLIIPFRRLRYSLAFAGTLFAGASLTFLNPMSWFFSSLSILSINLVLALAAKSRESARMRETLEELRQSTEDLALQTKINYNNTTVSHEVGEAISKYTRIDDVLDHVARIFEKQLNYDRA